MKPLTPMGARRSLAYSEKYDTHLAVGHRRALETVAAMRTEYREEEWQGCYPGWVPTSPWTTEKPVGDPDPHTRIVRRYVTGEEEIS